MEHLFILVDTSGSVVLEGIQKIGQINDFLRDVIIATIDHLKSIHVILYSDLPRVYFRKSDGRGFGEIKDYEFTGRSNLGKAYALTKKIMDEQSVDCSNSIIAIISDGEATDNYKKELMLLDPDQKSKRIAVGLGAEQDTLEDHINETGVIISDITSDNAKREFIGNTINTITI